MSAFNSIEEQHRLKALLTALPESEILPLNQENIQKYVRSIMRMVELSSDDQVELCESGLHTQFIKKLNFRVINSFIAIKEYQQKLAVKKLMTEELNSKLAQSAKLSDKLLDDYIVTTSISKEELQKFIPARTCKGEPDHWATLSNTIRYGTKKEFQLSHAGKQALKKAQHLAEEINSMFETIKIQDEITSKSKSRLKRHYTILKYSADCLLCFAKLTFLHVPKEYKKYYEVFETNETTNLSNY